MKRIYLILKDENTSDEETIYSAYTYDFHKYNSDEHIILPSGIEFVVRKVKIIKFEDLVTQVLYGYILTEFDDIKDINSIEDSSLKKDFEILKKKIREDKINKL